MPEYEINSMGEKFKVEAGSQEAASAAVANYQFMNFTGKLILLIFLIVPVIIAKLVGIVFALLGKIPIAGRILQSVLFAIASAFVCLIALAGISSLIAKGNVQWANLLGICGGFTFGAYWYYMNHYHIVKYMGVKIFSDILTRTFSIAFYGGIIGAIIGGIATKGNIAGVFMGLLIVFVGALVFYLKKTSQFAADAEQVREPVSAKVKGLFFTIAIAITGLGLTLGIIGDITSGIKYAEEKKKHEAAITEMIEQNPEMAIIRLATPFDAIVVSPFKGEAEEMNRREINIPEGAVITVISVTNSSGMNFYASFTYKEANIRETIRIFQKDFGSIKPQ